LSEVLKDFTGFNRQTLAMAKKGNRKMNGRRKAVIPKAIQSRVHVINRMWTGNVTKSATDNGAYRSVALGVFPISDITSLFAEYKIAKLEFSYILVNAPNNNANFPALYAAPQHYLSAGSPVSRDEVTQYQGVKLYQFGPAAVRANFSYTPVVQLITAGVGTSNVVSPWLNTASSNVPHLTNVEWFDRYNSTSDPTHTIQLVIRATILCRGTR